MTENEAFLQAIINDPDDDAPRLIYADYLEEHGQPERAEFIRVQCELTRVLAKRTEGGLVYTLEDVRRRQVLQNRERQLLKAHGDRWLGRLRRSLLWYQFQRGFVESIRIQAQSFLAHALALLRLGPLRTISFVGANMHILSLAVSPYLAQVEAIGLDRNRLSDASLRFLAQLPFRPRLSRLGLSGNDIGDAGVVTLANASGLASLKTLMLGANRIGDAGLQALAASPHLARLESLQLGGNGIDRRRQGARALVRRFGDGVQF